MSGCAKQTFTDITQSQFDCLVSRARTVGIAIVGNSGSTSKDGITVAWNFDAASQTLQIQCTDHPFYAPCGSINGKIHEIVDGCS